MEAKPPATRTLALLPWGNVFEDFLESAGVSWWDFCERFTGSFLFGYVDALHDAGVRVFMYCISRNRTPAVLFHQPSETTVRLFPVPGTYRLLRRAMRRPYAATPEGAFGPEVRSFPAFSFPPHTSLRSIGRHRSWRSLGR